MMRTVLILFYFGVSCQAVALVKSVIEHENDVKYMVYTKGDSQAVDIHDTTFTKNETIAFVIHGFQTTVLDNSLTLKDDIFKYDLNVDKVILLSWLDFSTYPSYQTLFTNYSSAIDKIASHHVPQLAEDITKKMVFIRNQGFNKIELIGHCLGAHAAGQAGRLYKQQMGEGINKIVGLSPTAHFFNENREYALNQNDSEHVLVIHTNTNKYSMKDQIGTKDLFINGGENQPKCKQYVLREDICSHNAAWEEYTNYLKGENNTRNKSHRYVICLDISGSMSGSRLKRAIHSAKVVIKALKGDSYMGIVAFNHKAQIIHPIVEIKGEDQRNALISALPNVASGGTCIDAGLKTSMEILKDDKLCSTIILISDGEPQCSEPVHNILSDLKKNCIKVNSVALGRDASQELEDISGQTEGVVHFVSESGEDKIQQFIEAEQALVSSYESGLNPDDRPIHFPLKEFDFENNEGSVNFYIDARIGKDTTFDVSGGGEVIDINVTSPNGTVYSSASSACTYDSFSDKHTCTIDNAEPGSWNIAATKKQKSKRFVRSTSTINARVGGKTHSLNGHAIKLDGTITNQTLEYPYSVEISAELRSGKFPVIHADVFAYIKDGGKTVSQLQLHDDGAHPDECPDDGVYTVSVIKLPKTGRYSIVVTASTNGTAQLVPKVTDYFSCREKIDCERLACQTLDRFERESNIGSIKLIPSTKVFEIPPTVVTDLRAKVTNKNEKEITLEWSCLVDDTKIKRFDIRVLVSGADFENAFQLNDQHIVKGSLDASNGSKLQRIIFRIPDAIWKFEPAETGFVLHLKFALKTIGVNNKVSVRSNLAHINIQDQCEIEKKQLIDGKIFLIGQIKEANDKVTVLANENQKYLSDLKIAKELLINETLTFKNQLEKNRIFTKDLIKEANDKATLLASENQQYLSDLKIAKELLKNEILAFKNQLEKNRIFAKDLSQEANEKVTLLASERQQCLIDLKVAQEHLINETLTFKNNLEKNRIFVKELSKEANDKVTLLTSENQQYLIDLKEAKDLLKNETLTFQKQLEKNKICTKDLNRVTSENLSLKSQLEAYIKLNHTEEMNELMKANLTEAKTKLTKLEAALDEIKTLKSKMNTEFKEQQRQHKLSELKCKQNEDILSIANKTITDLNHYLIYIYKNLSQLDYEKQKCNEQLQLLGDAYTECLNNDVSKSQLLKNRNHQLANISTLYEKAKRLLNACKVKKNNNRKGISSLTKISQELKNCERQNAEQYSEYKRYLDTCNECFQKMRSKSNY